MAESLFLLALLCWLGNSVQLINSIMITRYFIFFSSFCDQIYCFFLCIECIFPFIRKRKLVIRFNFFVHNNEFTKYIYFCQCILLNLIYCLLGNKFVKRLFLFAAKWRVSGFLGSSLRPFEWGAQCHRYPQMYIQLLLLTLSPAYLWHIFSTCTPFLKGKRERHSSGVGFWGCVKAYLDTIFTAGHRVKNPIFSGFFVSRWAVKITR